MKIKPSTRELVVSILAVLLFGVLIFFAYNPTSDFYGEVFSHAVTKNKVVALTFDDGPNGNATLQIMNILKQNNVPATFFFIGDNVKYYPQIAKQVSDNGFTLGNHTMHHDRILPFNDEGDIIADLNETNDVIYQTTGQKPTYFRPPHGFRTPWAISAVRKAGFQVIMWNDLTADYRQKSAGTIASAILKGVRPGSIIDLHDGIGTKHGANRDDVIEALPVIINSLKSQGYTFVSVSDLINGGSQCCSNQYLTQ